MTERLSPKHRTSELLDAALALAGRTGWRGLTRDAIAAAAGVSPGLVSARLGTMDALRRSVMRAAVKRRVARVVAEGLMAGDRYAQQADDALRTEAALLLTTR